PCCKMSRIAAPLAPGGSRNSPALIGSSLPRILARKRKDCADPTSPSFSSLPATEVSDAPDGTMNAVSSSTWLAPHQLHRNSAAQPNSSTTTAATTRHPLRIIQRPQATCLITRLALVPPKPKLL